MKTTGTRPLHVGQLNLPEEEAFRSAFQGIFDRRFFANHGPLEQQLDAALADYLGVRHAVSMVNGTAALAILLRALDLQGEVILPSFTFPATAQALVWAGLKPVFSDVDPETQAISAGIVEGLIGPHTSAVLGVHVWGRACDPEGLAALADRRGLTLLFDAAHAMGCSYRGKRIGGFGRAEMFSFHATKILNGAEGGCITTNDDDLAVRLRAMRSFHDVVPPVPGLLRMNAKISEAQAAMTLLGLDQLPQLIEANRRRYRLYRRELAGIPGLTFVDHAASEESNFQFVVVAVAGGTAGLSRDALLQVLAEDRILARRYFHPGVHRIAPFRDAAPPELPVTDSLCDSLLQLPSGQAITDQDVLETCARIRTAAGGTA